MKLLLLLRENQFFLLLIIFNINDYQSKYIICFEFQV